VRCDVAEAKRLLLAAGEAAVPGVALSVSEPDDNAMKILGLSGGSAIAVRADSRDAVRDRTDAIERALVSSAGAALRGIERYPAGMMSRVLVTPRRAESAALGVSLADAALAVKAATDGATVATVERGGAETPVVVFASGAGSADGTGSISGLMQIPVITDAGETIRASAVARYAVTTEPTAVARLDRSDVLYLKALPEAGRERAVENALERVMEKSPYVTRSGESATRRYGRAMASTVLLVLVLLYLTLGAQFESFRLPLHIMSTIPLALAGVGPALALTGTGLDSGSILGLVVLFGTVVNNAILLYEASVARRSLGASGIASAYAGASERIRPVLATTLTTLVAVLPLCLFSMDAAQRSMSITMLGGIAASTSLTLFVSPVVFAGDRVVRSRASRGQPRVRRRA